MAAPAGPDESANADLLPDTLQDGLDMDLLDDILSFGAMDMDWNKLEPSLMDDPIVQSMDMSTTQGIQDVSIQDVSIPAVELKPSPLPPPVALPIPAVVNNNNANAVPVPVSVPLVDMKPLLIQTAAIQTTQGAHQAVGAGSIAILSQAATSPPKSVDALSPQPQTAAAPVQAATTRKLINLPVLQPATSQNITLNGATTQGAIFSFPLAPGGQLYGLNLLTPVTVLGNTGEAGDKIPMKRLNAPAVATVAASAQQVVKKSEATRRTSHNAIERRYRSSINDKILELKDLVCTDGSDKVHKAAILKSSIEKIRHLKNANVRLEKENRALKSERRVCPNCHVEIASDLRVLLQQTPPHSSESDSSTPPSPDGQSSPGSSSGGTSPIALFAIAAGLFLINPVYHYGDEQSSASGPHSRVPRSVGNLKPEPFYDFEIWKPRIMAMVMNLVLFMIVYYISGKLFPKSRRTRPSKLYQSGKVMELMQRFKSKPRNAGERKAELVSALSYVNCSLPPRNRLALWIATMLEFTRVPLIPFRRMYKIEEDKDVAEIISKIYLELSRHDQSLQVWCGLKGLWWSLRSGKIEEILSNALLTRSKFILRAVVKWSKKNMLSHPMLNGTGLAFLFQNIKTWQYDENNLKSKLTTCCDPSDCLSQIVFRYKEEMLKLGVDKLYNSGEGSVDYFKGALQAVLSEKKARDVTCEWWTCILWTEAEWLIGGSRKQILERLYKVVDTLWAEKDDPMLKAVYYAHLAKREHMKGNIASQSLLNCASNSLRDSINMCLEKPTETTQYIWALTAEWVLEVQVGLWEETSDTSIALKFSRDLDTLRSLTHYVPSSLPTLYLYEACLRLMSHAAPGRTQQLLDASMKSGRLAQKTMLMCNEKEDLACKKRIEFNLVKEKRKAMALYLRCRFLPSQVITCPGEKAGMLREALKTLEAFGDKRKAGACLDMIKSLGGQSVTVH